MTALSKFLPWSECKRWGTPYFKNHSFSRIFAVVSAFWSRAANAWLNLVNTSVTTRKFSCPSVAGSRVVKSTAITSSGCEAKNGVQGAWILGWGTFANTHLWQFFTQFSTSLYIPPQKHLGFNKLRVRSMPWYPNWACTRLRTCSVRHAGKSIWWHSPVWTSSATRYKSPSFSLIFFHCFNRDSTGLDNSLLSWWVGFLCLRQSFLNMLSWISLLELWSILAR